MKIMMLQTDIVWESPARNRDKISEMIFGSEGGEDIIILPEMFTTGFTMTPQTLEEQNGVETLGWMLALSRERRAAVAGSIAVGEGGRYYNRLYFVRPDGTYGVYDKRHLFAYAGEDRKYTAGEERIILKYNNVRILLQICYDLRFPVFARNRGDYDMIIYCANWPESRIGVWNTLLRARAIENVCYVAGVNRTGNDPSNIYAGHTTLTDFRGDAVAEAQGPAEQIVTGYVEMDRLSAFREKFPALRDADGFELFCEAR